MPKRDLLRIGDLARDDLWRLLKLAAALKRERRGDRLKDKTIALVFQKPSLRTRVSFELAMTEQGGRALYLSPAEVGLGEREPVADVARVLARYVDGIVARTFWQRDIDQLAQWASIPVVNGLSDEEHPCQALADLLTIWEQKGRLDGVHVTFIGDGNNVAVSLMTACALAGSRYRIAVPKGYEPPAAIVERAQQTAREVGGSVEVLHDPIAASRGADVIYTDVWTSMGQEAEVEERRTAFAGYCVDNRLLALAQPDVIVMHDLPAHRGEEIADEAIEGPHSRVFDQAENRLHAQKAVLVDLLGGASSSN